jgi:radical SAM superfamily enzyme YgiQ (UPF0313 family)
MKILLIPNPIIRDGRPSTYIPLGILSLATVLRNDGFNAEIFDINATCSDPSYCESLEAILAQEPDVIGFSAWCNMYSYLVRLAEQIRDRKPNIKIIFGGVHATYTDLETIRAFPQVDMVVRGECDHTITDVMRALYDAKTLRQISGLTFRDGDEIVTTPYRGPVQELDDLPLPDYNLFPSMELVECVAIDVGRGCPFNCAYCVTNRMSERKFRLRSVENVMRIVRNLVLEHGKRHLRFEHDLLTLNRKWLLRLCKELEEDELDIEWSCFSRIDTVDEELLDKMAAAGCNSIYFGIESGSPRMQKVLSKGLRLDRAVPVVRRAYTNGIEVASGFITGFPQEELEDIADSMRLMMELYLAGDREISIIDFWLLVPFPGSPLFEEYGHTLTLDDHYSDFALHPTTPVDLEFIRRHPKVFSMLYHYTTERVDRTTFVRIIYLMVNLLRLRYTSFMITRDDRFGFPEKLLEHISLLELPPGNIYHHSGSHLALAAVCDFIKRTLDQQEFDGHIIHELMKFDLVWHSVWASCERGNPFRIEDFTCDILEFITQVKCDQFQRIPSSVDRRPCALLFRKTGELTVDIVKLPPLFQETCGRRGQS